MATTDPSRTDEAATGPGPRSCLANLAVVALACLLSLLARRFPKSAVLPTFAFFTWAYLFLRAVIEFPAELGMVPTAGEDDGESDEADGIDDD